MVPNYVQIGLCESPPFFCAASETARDLIASLLQEVHLPPHTFEDQVQGPTDAYTYGRLGAYNSFVNLAELFVDDFISVTNNTNQ